MRIIHKRIAAGVVGVSMSLGAVAYALPLATAQTGNQAPSAAFNENAPVSLTIEKRGGDPALDAGINPDNPPLAGVTFTVAQVDISATLGTAAAWAEISGLTASSAALQLSGDTWSGTTGVNGQIVFNDGQVADGGGTSFGQGVYLVTETQANGYTVAAPFLVTLPFTDSAGTWAYDQVVIPKNQSVSVGKTVTDQGASLGSTIDYVIEASVPAGEMNRFRIIDDLPDALDPATDVVINTFDALAAAPASRTPLLSTDYSVNAAVGDGNELIIDFEAGLDELEALRMNTPGLMVEVIFKAHINAIPESGLITNHATVELPNNATIDTLDGGGPDEPGDGAQTRIGDLEINLVDVSEQALIAGSDSTFELWRCTGNDTDGYEIIEYTQVNAVDPRDTSTSTDVFTIAEGNSSVILDGVQAFDWVDSAAVLDFLCAVQITAPDGYALNPEPQKVEYDSEAPGDYDMVVDVINLEDTIIGQLPATGGAGAILIIAAGLLVAGAGGAVAIRGKRAAKSDQR